MRSKLQGARRLPGPSRSVLIKVAIPTAIATLLVHWKIDLRHRRFDETLEVKTYGNRPRTSTSGGDTHWVRTGGNPECLSAWTCRRDPRAHGRQDRRTTARPHGHR